MSLIVETGAGLPDAESYISVVDADAYFSKRGDESWVGLGETEKEAALRKGTDYIEATYGQAFMGARVSAEQALSWPRAGVVFNGFALASNAVPEHIRRATAELAVRSIDQALAADEGPAVTEETVGPLTTKYAAGAAQATRYRFVEGLLGPLLRGSSGQIRLVRA